MPDLPLAAILLNLVVFAAALFQTVTGIGFALIAGPFLLVVIDNTSAVQTSIILNLLMSAILAPILMRHISRLHLRQMVTGTVIGLPAGVALFVLADITALKLGAGLLIAATIILSFWKPKPGSKELGGWAGVVSGIASGAMTGFAAMPGPAASLYLTGFRGLERDTARATIFMLFLFSYAAALAVHGLTTGLHEMAIGSALSLAPMTVAGMLTGFFLAPRIDQRYFKAAVMSVLMLTAATLVVSALR